MRRSYLQSRKPQLQSFRTERRTFNEPALVQRIRVDVDLNVVLVTHVESADDDRRSRTPVFVQLQTCRTRLDDILQRLGACVVTLAGESKVHREAVGRREHLLHVEWTRGTSCRVGSGTRTSTTTDHRSRARCECLCNLLRADVVTVRVDGTGSDDELLPRNDFRSRADDEVGVDSGHDIRVPSFADPFDLAILDTDVCLR